MKALSIEEIKQLKCGDCVWIKTNNSQYLRVNFSSEILSGETLCGIKTYYYADYNKTWLAYKNKEQAECKGVLKSLICDIGDKVYIVKKICNCFSIDDGIIECITIIGNTIYYNWNSYDYRGEQIELWDEGEFTADDLGKSIFLDYKQAEQKLKELRGE